MLTWNLEDCHTFQVPPPMSDTASKLGVCPFCEAVIPAEAVLLEYEVNGENRIFAECYECDEPVQPQ